MTKKEKRLHEMFEKALSFKDDDEKLSFESWTIQDGFMGIIQKFMEDESLTERGLSKVSSISRRTIHELFTGDRRLTIKHMALFQRAMNNKIIFFAL